MSRPRSAYLALILAAACWGLGTIVSKRAVAEFPPLTLLPIQLAASLVVLAVLLPLRGLPLRDRSAPALLGRLGLLNPGLAYALSLIGLVQISASLSVLLWAVEPLLILALAAVVLGERPGRLVVALSILAAGGMGLILYEPGTSGTLVGIGLTLAGVGCCAVYTVVARRSLGTVTETGPIVAAQQAWALGLALAVVLALWLVGGAVRPQEVTPLGVASAVGSGVLYYGLAYTFYLSALRRLTASAAAASFYLIPIFGVAGAVLTLGDQLALEQWIGAGIVLASVAAILHRRPAAAPVAA